MAEIEKRGEKYSCTCNQLMDLGTRCPHIFRVCDVDPDKCCHPMWRASTFKAAFLSEQPAPGGCREVAVHPGSNQQGVISAVMRAPTLSNGTTEAVLKLRDTK